MSEASGSEAETVPRPYQRSSPPPTATALPPTCTRAMSAGDVDSTRIRMRLGRPIFTPCALTRPARPASGVTTPWRTISLAGARNPLIEIAIDRASARGLLMVAAIGNNGPDGAAAWPAAHPSVVAVTAIGPDAGLYRAAVHGPEVDFAAPGVSVWSGGIDGAGRFDSGTSFAVPFVTAAGAAWLARGGAADADAFRAAFAQTARDLGAPGRDPEFGDGLIELADACAADTTK